MLQAVSPDVVVRCSPSHPAFALPAIIKLLSAKVRYTVVVPGLVHIATSYS